MEKISTLIITKNEQEHLEECMRSVRWTDELVIVDSGSTDQTVEIAKKYTKKVYYHRWSGYSDQKNWGAGKCRYDWVLSIDADERVTPELRKEIEDVLEKTDYDGFWIPLRDFMFGKWIYYGQWYPQEHIRLYRKSKSVWSKNVHETVSVNGDTYHLKNPLTHVGHTDITEFIYKLNIYTGQEAKDRFARGEKINLRQAVFKALKIFREKFFLHQGRKDGGHGFILAVLMAFYSFASDIKLWELLYKKEHREKVT